MSDERLAEIKARESKATPGPWTASRFGWVDHVPHASMNRTAFDRVEDADFIAHAREDIPYLLAELERSQRETAALRAAANQAIDGLADLVCVHGATFDSNEYPDWDSHCPACAALRPLVRVLAAQPAAADAAGGAA